MIAISPQRIALALQTMSHDDGFRFEEFVNGFLASEFTDLRPVAGVHDGGVDAFIHTTTDAPGTFFSYSIRKDWETKIRSSVNVLQKNGHAVRELIYCSNQDVQRHATSLKQEFRKLGISLDIRDADYFVAHANDTQGSLAACVALAKDFVDPLLAEKAIIQRTGRFLSSDDERLAAAYLQCTIPSKDPSKSYTKFCVESLVQFALRAATPEQPTSRAEVHAHVCRFTPNTDTQRTREQVDGALNRLRDKGTIKHHTKPDAFTLSYAARQTLRSGQEQFAAQEAAAHAEAQDVVEKVIRDLEVDYKVPVADMAADVMTLLDRVVVSQGQAAAEALARSGRYHADVESLRAEIEKLLESQKDLLLAAPQMKRVDYIELASESAQEVMRHPSGVLGARLTHAANAYCLLFILRESGDVQKVLDDLLGSVSVLVDTTIIIQCMAESVLPRNDRRISNLLRAGARIGMRLTVNSDILEELETHLDRVRYIYTKYTIPELSAAGDRGVALASSLLISVYLQAARVGAVNSFDAFLEQFKGHEDPAQDLRDYLKHELAVEFDAAVDDAACKVAHATIGDIYEQWKTEREKRKPSYMTEQAFEKLVYHDAKAYCALEHMRAEDAKKGVAYGRTWWWLTLDRVPFRIDRKNRGTKQAMCMSPDFFVRHVSLRTESDKKSDASIPISLEMSRLGLVPSDLRSEVGELLVEMRGQPTYLQQRRLRDFVNKAYAQRGRMHNEGVRGAADRLKQVQRSPDSK